jgi:hypothetical protein
MVLMLHDRLAGDLIQYIYDRFVVGGVYYNALDSASTTGVFLQSLVSSSGQPVRFYGNILSICVGYRYLSAGFIPDRFASLVVLRYHRRLHCVTAAKVACFAYKYRVIYTLM